MIFVDTSAWYALFVNEDSNHSSAVAFLNEISSGKFGKMVTTDYVLAETYTLLRLRKGAEIVGRASSSISRSSNLRIVWVGEENFALALEILLNYNDKKLSFADCTSFVMMKALGISDAFAFDTDFRSTGFHLHPE
jgi:hypothetical protein